MKPIPVFSDCPHCHDQLRIRQLECTACGLRLEGPFQGDPLSRLGDEELRFVRLFLHCEGSIRDMEKALGISYPTVKARLAALNAKLASETAPPTTNAPSMTNDPPPVPPTPPTRPRGGRSILDQLADGDVDFETALKSLQKGKPHAK